MRGKVEIYRTDGEKKNGFPVKLILSHTRQGEKTKQRRKTLAYSKDKDWNHDKQLPLPTHPDYEYLYDKITSVQREVSKLHFSEMDNFDRAFSFLLGSRAEAGFLEYGERLAKEIEERRPGSARAYRLSLNELKKFSPGITFKELTPELLEAFKRHKKSAGLKNTSIKHYLVEYRAIYNKAVKIGITEDRNPFNGLFADLPVKKRRARNRYLSREHIKLLEGVNLDPSYQRAVDLSLLQFYLCGADLTDVYYLRHSDISGNRVFLTRNKLGDRAYEFDVLLTAKAQRIIDRYKVPGEYIFPWRKAPESYITFRNNHNRNLKIIQKRLNIELLPKNDHLTTKVMRHTFATLGKFEHIQEDILRELMGHERNDIDTVYKDKYEERERDEAQLRVISMAFPYK